MPKRSRGQKHRQERPRRPLPGMLVHTDGSTHQWIPGLSWKQDLIAFVDDATTEVYEAFLCQEEGTVPILSGLKTVIAEKGLF